MNKKFKNSDFSNDSYQKLLGNKKIIFLFSCSVLFAMLSFVCYEPQENELINNQKISLLSIDEKKSSSLKDNYTLEIDNEIVEVNKLENDIALIVGSYQEKINAVAFGNQMKNKGFKYCKIIKKNNSPNYWVVLNLYKNKEEAILARERFLINGWIKQM